MMKPDTDVPMVFKNKALEVLGAQEKLFAVLDSARTNSVHALLRDASEEYQSLYEGPEAAKLDRVAPFLIALPKGSPTLNRLIQGGWGKSWCIYFSSRQPFKEVRRYLRRFLMVEDEQTQEQLYFRFYDPRVLRVFLPSCALPQRSEFFGEIDCFWMESVEGEPLAFPRTRSSS